MRVCSQKKVRAICENLASDFFFAVRLLRESLIFSMPPPMMLPPSLVDALPPPMIKVSREEQDAMDLVWCVKGLMEAKKIVASMPIPERHYKEPDNVLQYTNFLFKTELCGGTLGIVIYDSDITKECVEKMADLPPNVVVHFGYTSPGDSFLEIRTSEELQEACKSFLWHGVSPANVSEVEKKMSKMMA